MNGNILQLAKALPQESLMGLELFGSIQSLQPIYIHTADGCACAFKASFKITAVM